MSPARNSLPVMTQNATSNQKSLFHCVTLMHDGGQQIFSGSCETTLKSAWSRDLATNCCPYSWEKLLGDILYEYESRLKETRIGVWSKYIH